MISKLEKRGWYQYDYVGVQGDTFVLSMEHDVYCATLTLRVEASDWDQTTRFTFLTLYTTKGEEIGAWDNLDMDWDAFEKMCEEAEGDDEE